MMHARILLQNISSMIGGQKDMISGWLLWSCTSIWNHTWIKIWMGLRGKSLAWCVEWTKPRVHFLPTSLYIFCIPEVFWVVVVTTISCFVVMEIRRVFGTMCHFYSKLSPYFLEIILIKSDFVLTQIWPRFVLFLNQFLHSFQNWFWPSCWLGYICETFHE